MSHCLYRLAFSVPLAFTAVKLYPDSKYIDNSLAKIDDRESQVSFRGSRSPSVGIRELDA